MRKLVSMLAIVMVMGLPVIVSSAAYESMDVPTVIIVGEEEFKPTSIIYPEYKDTLVASGVVDLKKFNAPDFAKVKRISELLQRVNVKSYNLEK